MLILLDVNHLKIIYDYYVPILINPITISVAMVGVCVGCRSLNCKRLYFMTCNQI